MILIVIIFLICLSAVQLFCFFRMKKQENQWLSVLRSIRYGESEKLFAKGDGRIASFSFEFNEIMNTNQFQIAQLKKSNEANKQILTSLSHDIRTPLASLLGYLEVLEKNSLEEKDKQEYIKVAFRKANDLKAYVDTLFEWFKLSGGEYQLSIEKVDINEKTREIIIEWLPVLEQLNILLTVNTKDEELMVSLDSMAYSRIINNLVQNAIQHGNCNQIVISVTHNATAVLISVNNNGQIISKEHLPYIFERLYKVDHARSKKGSGLGLAITKELVLALHGEITAFSSQNEGTTFQITLPI